MVIKMNSLKLNFLPSSCLLLLTLKYCFFPGLTLCFLSFLPTYGANHMYSFSVICSLIFLCTCHIRILSDINSWHSDIFINLSFLVVCLLQLLSSVYSCSVTTKLFSLHHLSVLHISVLISK